MEDPHHYMVGRQWAVEVGHHPLPMVVVVAEEAVMVIVAEVGAITVIVVVVVAHHPPTAIVVVVVIGIVEAHLHHHHHLDHMVVAAVVSVITMVHLHWRGNEVAAAAAVVVQGDTKATGRGGGHAVAVRTIGGEGNRCLLIKRDRTQLSFFPKPWSGMV